MIKRTAQFLTTVLVYFVFCNVSLAVPLNKDNYGANILESAIQVDAHTELSFPLNYREASTWQYKSQKTGRASIFGGDLWYVVPIEHSFPSGEYVLAATNFIADAIEVRLYSEHSDVQISRTGANYEIESPFHFANKMQLENNQSYLAIIHIQSDYFYTTPKLLFQSVQDFDKSSIRENTIMLLCFGIGIALGLYNLLIYFVSREKMHLYYALFTASWVFAWSHFFLVPQQLLSVNTAPVHWLGFILLPLTNALFFIPFLKLDKYFPQLKKAALGIGVGALIGIPISFVFPGFGFLWATLVTGTMMLVGLSSGILSLQRGFKPAKYFILAYLAMLLPNMLGNLNNLGLLPFLNINFYLWGLVGTTLDALLLAFAVADKLRLINQDNIDLSHNLELKVRERTIALEVLADELKDANLAKSRFLANMSHEIRTPMTSILGYVDALNHKESLSGDEQKHALHTIQKNSRHLLSLINDILDVSKIEANKLKIEQVPTDIFQILTEVGSILGRQVRDKGLVFNIDYQFPLPNKIMSDPVRLRQILLNLASNSVKFTRQGSVCIKVAMDGKVLKVTIVDTGIGMDKKALAGLFTPFYQGDLSTTRKYGGTGLGLHISKNLVERLGGSISVYSKPQQGSKFSICLPCELTDETRWLEDYEVAVTSAPSNDETNQLVALQGNILLAEDHPDNQLLISRMLEKVGFTITCVDNGEQALAEALIQEFDIILLDIQMPVMDGVEAQSLIRSTGVTTPIIALTANAMSDEIKHYLSIGFDDHIAKPIDNRDFYAKLSKYIESPVIEVALPEQEFQIMRQQFVNNLTEQKELAEHLFCLGDNEQLKKLCHSLYGAAGMFGYADLGDKAKDLEVAITNQSAKEINLVYQSFIREIKQAR